MAWTAPSVPVTGQLITAGFWQAQIPDNLTVLKVSIDDNGHLRYVGVPVTGIDYTLAATDDVLYVDATAGSYNVHLPPAASVPGKKYLVKKYDGGTNQVFVLPNGSDVIDGQGSYVLEVSLQSVTLYSHIGNWWIH